MPARRALGRLSAKTLPALTAFAAFTAVAAISSAARADQQCGRGMTSAGAGYGWCIERDADSRNPDFLYYLHGGGGSERAWHGSQMQRDLENLWHARGAGAPTVITISFGPQWLVGDVPTSEHPALLPLIVKEVIPTMERRAGGLRGRRLLMGHSMGGANTTILAMRAPELFARAAALCPGILATSPDATPEELERFFAANSPLVHREWYLNSLAWVKHDFVTPENWQRHDVLRLATGATPRITPTFFVSCSWDDGYGFYPGAERFAGLLEARGVPVTWEPIAHGPHCASTPQSRAALALFLTAPDPLRR